MRYCHRGHSGRVNRPFWYTEHTVITGDEWHLTYSAVKRTLGWYTPRNSEQRKIIQKVLYTVQSVGGPRRRKRKSSITLSKALHGVITVCFPTTNHISPNMCCAHYSVGGSHRTLRPASLLWRFMAARASCPVSKASTNCLEMASPKPTLSLQPPHSQPWPPGRTDAS